MYEINKLASDLNNFDNDSVVKTAGVLRKIKNFVKKIFDTSYQEEVGNLQTNWEEIKYEAKALSEAIEGLESSVKDYDVVDYDEKLNEVKRLSLSLSSKFKEVSKQTDEMHPPADILKQYSYQDYTSSDFKSKLPPLPAGHDVPIGNNINIKFSDSKWLSQITPDKIVMRAYAKQNLKQQIIKAIGFHDKTFDVKKLDCFDSSLNDFNDSVYNEVAKAIVNGTIISYFHKVPPKNPKEGNLATVPSNQMEMDVVTDAFQLPGTDIKLKGRLVLIDLLSSYVKRDMLSLRRTTNMSVVNPNFGKSDGNAPMPKEDLDEEAYMPELDDHLDFIDEANSIRLEKIEKLAYVDRDKTHLLAVPGIENTSSQFRKKLVDISAKLSIDPNWLATAISQESLFNPKAVNKSSKATGLIQFLPSTAKALGTTIEELSRKSSLEQLDVVYKYMAKFAGKMHSLDDVYLAIFYPAAIGAPKNKVLFKYPSKAYLSNKSLDTKNTGTITVEMVSKCVHDKMAAAKNKMVSVNEGVEETGETGQSQQVADNDQFNEQEFSGILEKLLSTAGVGRVEEIVRNAIASKVLPHSNFVISIISKDKYAALQYAILTSNALVDAINADVEICGEENIDINCKVCGSLTNSEAAVKEVCKITQAGFNAILPNNKIMFSLENNCVSKYAATELESLNYSRKIFKLAQKMDIEG